MSKKEIIKEYIATYRAYLLLITTSLFGIIGYAIINIDKLTTTQMVLGIAISITLCVSFGFLLRQYFQARKKLGVIE